VVSQNESLVYQYSIGTDGKLTPMIPGTIATDVYPQDISIDPSGRYAYVANGDGDNVSQYLINGDGSLSPLTPATVAGEIAPQAIITTGAYQ
jgi:DNA-binding beta-propeller fold protein YncE